jgi:hypothetical protein
MLKRQTPLAEIRGIIRGWAFAPIDWLPNRIKDAEAIAQTLPEASQAEAATYIQPLRDRVAKESPDNA